LIGYKEIQASACESKAARGARNGNPNHGASPSRLIHFFEKADFTKTFDTNRKYEILPRNSNIGAYPVTTDNDPQRPVFDYLFSLRFHSEFSAGRV
jgi:hypothetical protein